MNTERNDLRKARIEAISGFVEKHLDRQLLDGELTSLSRLKDQDLHLIAAALDEVSLNELLAAYVSVNDAELERDDFLRKGCGPYPR